MPIRFNKIPLIIAVFAFSLSSAIPAVAGRIINAIDVTHVLNADGRLLIEARFSNDGDVTLHHVTGTVFFDEQASRSPDLGDCRAGNTISFTTQFDASGVAPGQYIAMVRFNFEEPSSLKHRTFHPHYIFIRGDTQETAHARLKASAAAPTFNPKAFWQKKDRLRLTLENGHNEAITPHIVFYLPDAFFSPHGTLRPSLAPGQTKTIDVQLVYTREYSYGGKFVAVAQYKAGGRHYATAVDGHVMVTSRPALLKYYAAAALSILALAALFITRRTVRVNKATAFSTAEKTD